MGPIPKTIPPSDPDHASTPGHRVVPPGAVDEHVGPAAADQLEHADDRDESTDRHPPAQVDPPVTHEHHDEHHEREQPSRAREALDDEEGGHDGDHPPPPATFGMHPHPRHGCGQAERQPDGVVGRTADRQPRSPHDGMAGHDRHDPRGDGAADHGSPEHRRHGPRDGPGVERPQQRPCCEAGDSGEDGGRQRGVPPVPGPHEAERHPGKEAAHGPRLTTAQQRDAPPLVQRPQRGGGEHDQHEQVPSHPGPDIRRRRHRTQHERDDNRDRAPPTLVEAPIRTPTLVEEPFRTPTLVEVRIRAAGEPRNQAPHTPTFPEVRIHAPTLVEVRIRAAGEPPNQPYDRDQLS